MKLGNTQKTSDMRKFFDTTTVLRFGAHEGKALIDVPHSYIFWMVSNFKDSDFSDEVLDIANDFEYEKENGSINWGDIGYDPLREW